MESSLTDDEIRSLAIGLANGGDPNLSGLSDADFQAVWRSVHTIISERRRAGLELAERNPKHRGMSRDRALQALGDMGIPNPADIVAEIMREPLMVGILLVLSSAMRRRPNPSPKHALRLSRGPR